MRVSSKHTHTHTHTRTHARTHASSRYKGSLSTLRSRGRQAMQLHGACAAHWTTESSRTFLLVQNVFCPNVYWPCKILCGDSLAEISSRKQYGRHCSQPGTCHPSVDDIRRHVCTEDTCFGKVRKRMLPVQWFKDPYLKCDHTYGFTNYTTEELEDNQWCFWCQIYHWPIVSATVSLPPYHPTGKRSYCFVDCSVAASTPTSSAVLSFCWLSYCGLHIHLVSCPIVLPTVLFPPHLTGQLSYRHADCPFAFTTNGSAVLSLCRLSCYLCIL